MKRLLPLLMLMGVTLPANAASVIPNFTRGAVTSETTTSTTVTETIRVVEYSTGTSYNVTGTNINIPANPTPGATYTIANQGEPFQFSETYLGPGIASETWIDRTTTVNSFTTSLSVFTQ